MHQEGTLAHTSSLHILFPEDGRFIVDTVGSNIPYGKRFVDFTIDKLEADKIYGCDKQKMHPLGLARLQVECGLEFSIELGHHFACKRRGQRVSHRIESWAITVMWHDYFTQQSLVDVGAQIRQYLRTKVVLIS